MKTVELLSPAGNLQSVFKAIQNGADAVYFGGKSFGARAFAANFTYDEMKQAIDYAHLYGAKAYITVNTLVYEQEIPDFLGHTETVYSLGADALIMQDIGMIALVSRRYPDIEIHASTQTHSHNDDSLCFVRELGAVRAVLAREMSIDEIKDLNCDIEKEVFIHGALCVCYSGQCLMSALTKGRSGNRGECAQSCRMRYKLLRDGECAKTDGDYLISPKDLALFEDIEKLINAGVCCFKIEGRMKPHEYVGHVTKIYAGLLESYKNGEPLKVKDEDIRTLEKLFNRGFTKGHILGMRGKELMGTLRPNHRGVPLGRVISLSKDSIKIALEARLNQSDGIKFEKSDTGFICNRIFKNGRLVSGADKGDVVELDRKADAETGESVVKTSDAELLEQLREIGNRRKVVINGRLSANAGVPLRLEITDQNGHSVSVSGDAVQQCRTSPTLRSDIEKSLNKLGDTPYAFGELDIDCGENIFVAKSAINALRREASDKLTEARIHIKERRTAKYSPQPVRRDEVTGAPRLHVLVRTREQFDAVKRLPLGDIYTSDKSIYFGSKDEYKNLRLRTDRLAKSAGRFSGERLLAADNGGIYAHSAENDITVDYTVWALNSYSLSYLADLSAKRVALSPELDMAQTALMIDAYTEANGQPPPVEAVVYARHELMAMRHCVISQESNCGLCKKSRYELEDLQGNRFPLITDDNCNNYILNCRYIEADVKNLLALGIKHFRVELSGENAKESRETAQRFLDMIRS